MQQSPLLLVRDARFRKHDAGYGHPERPERYDVLSRLFDQRWEAGVFDELASRAATFEELSRVHLPAYVERMLDLRGASVVIDADTRTCPETIEAAEYAAGAAINMVEAIVERDARGFALLRPPGHHAEPGRAMGFCYFNNVAIAAAAALQRANVERVAIFDWDVHHGNGTQAAFYTNPNVLFASAHGWPLYPGSGSEHEIGSGAGRGSTLNFPLAAGSTDADLLYVIAAGFLPVARAFKPDLLLISAGYDGHARDPLAPLDYSEEGFVAATSALLQFAETVCRGRLGLVLEGGYDLSALAASVAATIDVLRGERNGLVDAQHASDDVKRLTARVLGRVLS